MEHLTGLQWSAGLFGLAIGIVVGAVSTWFAMRPPRAVSDAEIQDALTDLSQFARGEAVGDVPATPEPLERCGNPLVIRMYERWLDADARGDSIAVRRQEIRMLSNGVETPWSRADAETRLARLKGETP